MFATDTGLANGRQRWQQQLGQSDFWQIADYVALRRPAGVKVVRTDAPDLFATEQPIAVGRPLVPPSKVAPAGPDPEAKAPLPDFAKMKMAALRQAYVAEFKRSPRGMGRTAMLAALDERHNPKPKETK